MAIYRSIHPAWAGVLCCFVAVGCSDKPASVNSGELPLNEAHPIHSDTNSNQVKDPQKEHHAMGQETVTLGAGCFWCIEAVLDRIKGVESVESGYMGGHVKNPTYEQVCEGITNHAEVVQVTFDPDVLPFDKLLDIFWKLHDPTTLNRQGFDVGTQYRSAIFFHTEAQRETAEASKAKWDASGEYSDPIVTEIAAASTFYPAEDYHQDFFSRNPSNPYCRANILPKFDKLGIEFKP